MLSSEKSFRLFLLELSWLLKELFDSKKKTMKNSFALDPSNPSKSIQETDKHMNSKKIFNLANPTDQQDTVTKKYVDEK